MKIAATRQLLAPVIALLAAGAGAAQAKPAPAPEPETDMPPDPQPSPQQPAQQTSQPQQQPQQQPPEPPGRLPPGVHTQPEPPATGKPPEPPPKATTAPQPNWFLDGGVIPFLYGSTAIALGTTLATPPSPPILFSNSEGGAPTKPDTIPSWEVSVYNAVLAGTLAAFDRPARWYHFKGMLESFATTVAVNQLAKITFGRHRPSYDPVTSTNKDDRMSFFSEHSSVMAAGTVYFGMYLHQHGFAKLRGDSVLAWWEIPVYAGLTTLAVYVPYTRVEDNKHHVSDVVVGAAVGTAFSIVFYTYQERRYRRAAAGAAGATFSFLPWTTSPGATVAFTF